MPAYDPPDAHYAHINIPDYDVDTVFRFVGKDGWRFKKLTRELNVYYIYYHHEDKRISVHGSYKSMLNEPCKKVVEELDKFIEHEKTCSETLMETDDSIVKENNGSHPPSPSSDPGQQSKCRVS